MRSKTRESSKGPTTISIDKRKANVEKSDESDLRYVADLDWEHVISGHGLVGRLAVYAQDLRAIWGILAISLKSSSSALEWREEEEEEEEEEARHLEWRRSGVGFES
ncbi:unnamed protein product [Sphagnum jensenii]